MVSCDFGGETFDLYLAKVSLAKIRKQGRIYK